MFKYILAMVFAGMLWASFVGISLHQLWDFNNRVLIQALEK